MGFMRSMRPLSRMFRSDAPGHSAPDAAEPAAPVANLASDVVIAALQDGPALRALAGLNDAAPAAEPAIVHAAQVRLAQLIEHPVIRENEVGGVGDEEVILADLDALALERLEIADERDGIDDDAVADDADLFGPQDAAGDKVEDVFLVAENDGVAGVVTALRTHDDIGMLSQEVDDLAFAFVAPLSPDQDGICHGI